MRLNLRGGHVLALVMAGSQPTWAAAPPAAASTAEASAPAVVRINGIELHYVDRAAGVPVVFVHGGLADYRELLPVADLLPDSYRTVNYSRRHSFPNSNGSPAADHTMLKEVDDLVGLIEALELGPVHAVGVSYGAYTSLILALRRPDLVRSVTAAEPPLLHWLPEIEGGREANEHFTESVMKPSATAFSNGDPVAALAVAVDYFAGPNGMETIPSSVRDMLLANIEDWRAITTSPGIFPLVTREEIASIRAPLLIISGAKTAAVHRLVDPELARVVPGAERVVIAEGTHDMCAEQPGACAAAIASFIARRQR